MASTLVLTVLRLVIVVSVYSAIRRLPIYAELGHAQRRYAFLAGLALLMIPFDLAIWVLSR